MEGILSIVGGLILLVGINVAFRLFFGAVRATGRTLVGKGSFADNFEYAFKGMNALECRLSNKTLNSDGTGPRVVEIEIKGAFPREASQYQDTVFVTSVFDETDGELTPVLSHLDGFQETTSRVFQYTAPMGRVLENQGFVSWIRAGVVIPDLIQPPSSGTRKLVAILRMLDASSLHLINHGFHTESPAIFWQRSLRFEHSVRDKGYLEAARDRDKAIGLTIKLGVVLAMVDGTLSEEKGTVLKNWIRKTIQPFSEARQSELKEIYNKSFRENYALAKNQQLSITDTVVALNDIADKSTKYEAIDLCFDLMAAGKEADIEALGLIRLIAEALELDLDEIEKMKDQRIVNLGASLSDQASIESLLGIQAGWSNDQIKAHLRAEFQKWNNRLNAVEGEERQSAQRMLDLIAQARKKYV